MTKADTHFTLRFYGYSMYPVLKPGDRLVARQVSPNALELGDIIITPGTRNKYTAHRLVGLQLDGKAILKGDALLSTDPDPVDLTTVLGRVDAVIRNDRLINISTGPLALSKKIHAWLSLRCLTIGALRLRFKNLFQKCFTTSTPANNKKEMRLLTSIINTRRLEVPPDLNWGNLINLSIQEGVAGVIYFFIRGKDIPESFQKRLEVYYLQTAATNLILIKALEEVEEALNNEGIEVMVLKGASLLDIFYPGLGMRPMDDIDIMVRPENLERLLNVLSLLGYERNPRIPHVFYRAGITMDIHVHALNVDRITSRSALFPKGMGPIWKESLPWKKSSYRLRRPNDMDNVFLLSQHLLKHSFSKLIWLVDILQIVKDRDEVFWESLAKRMEYLGQTKPFWYTLYLLEHLFNLKTPPSSDFNVQSSDFSKFEQGMLKAKKKGESLNRIGPLLLLFYISGLKGRISFFWETIFPKQEILEQEFVKSLNGDKWVFYPSRVVHMIILFFGHISYFFRAFIQPR